MNNLKNEPVLSVWSEGDKINNTVWNRIINSIKTSVGFDPIANISNTIASVPDARDYIYVPKATVPSEADLQSSVGFIEDQGQIGSCTANATCSAIELICEKTAPRSLSRLFNYYCSRARDNMLGQDGATLRSAIKAAANEGLPLEEIYPYLPDIRDVKPSQEIYDIAAKTQLLQYERIVPDLNSGYMFPLWHAVKSAISDGFPVVIAMRVSNQFLSLRGKNMAEQNYLGCMNGDPPAPYFYVGNHALIVTGYSGDQINLENSWGTGWGHGGMGYIGATTLESDVYEAWVVKGFAEVSAGPVQPIEKFVTEPATVLTWYAQVWRMDVTSVTDEGVLYWARHAGGKNAFLLHWKYLVQKKCDELLT